MVLYGNDDNGDDDVDNYDWKHDGDFSGSPAPWPRWLHPFFWGRFDPGRPHGYWLTISGYACGMREVLF